MKNRLINRKNRALLSRKLSDFRFSPQISKFEFCIEWVLLVFTKTDVDRFSTHIDNSIHAQGHTLVYQMLDHFIFHGKINL
jgi:hypothetical protein